VKVLSTKSFSRCARREKISDTQLIKTIERANQGLIDADLGGFVIKQRIPRTGQGRSGGFRSIIAFRKESLAFFIYGFSKGDKDNVSVEELKNLKEAAKVLMKLKNRQLEKAIEKGTLIEVKS